MQASPQFLTKGFMAAAMALCIVALQAVAQPADLRFFRIATGSASNTSFPVAMAIATAISNPPGSRPCERGGSCGVPGLVAVAQTSEGGLANLALVSAGVFDSGLVQADLVSNAYHGEGPYFRASRMDNVRVIANLYPESVHLVARKGAGIERVSDLAGKRVSIDKPGSGVHANADLVLAAHGLRLSAVRAVEADAPTAVSMLEQGQLDAMFLIGGFPVPAVSDLARQDLITLVPIQGRAADAILRRQSFFSRAVIPSNIYPGIGETSTIAIGMQWVTSAEKDADLVYQITKALWHPNNRRALNAGHRQGAALTLGQALRGVTTPLHEGAERFYREQGLLN